MQVKDHFLTQEEFEIKDTDTTGIKKTWPIPSQLNRYYQSPKYISHHQDNGSLKERIYKFVQSFNLNYKRNIVASLSFKNASVLDYGCGAGEFLKTIEEDFITYGYEPSKVASEAAKNKLKKTHLVTDLEDLPNSSLDVITLWHVLEHIENQEDIINKLYNKLKPNGLLILALPNYKSYDAQHYKSYWAAYDVPRHLYHFSKTGIESKFNSNSWKLKQIKPLLLDSIYISILSEKYKKNPFAILSGGLIGVISNFKALKTNDYSSLIYIIEKTENV